MARAIVRLTQSLPVAENVRAQALLRLGGILRWRTGKLDEAEQCMREALAAYRKIGGKRPGLAESLSVLSDILSRQGRQAEAEALRREAVAIDRKMFGNENLNTAHMIWALACQLRSHGKLVEAESLAREALAIRKKRLSSEHREVAQSILLLAGILGDQGKWAEAETLLRDELSPRRQRLHPDVIEMLDSLGHALQSQGRLSEAEATAREALDSARNTWANTPRRLEETVGRLEEILRLQGKLGEVETLRREHLATQRKLLGNEHADVANPLCDLALFLRDQGKWAEAVTMLRETGNALAWNNLAWLLATDSDPKRREGTSAVSCAEMAVVLTGHTNAMYLDTLAAAYAEVGQFTNAVNKQKEAIALLTNPGWKEGFVARLRLYESGLPYRDDASLAQQISALLAAGKFAEAEPLARECLAICEKQIPDDWVTFNTRSLLGASLLGQKKYAEAEPLLLAGCEGMKQRGEKIPANDKLRLKEALQRLVQLYEATGHPDQAAAWKQKLAEFDKAETEPKPAAPPR